MSKKSAVVFSSFVYLTLASIVLAANEVPDVDPLAQLLTLIADFKNLSPLAIASAVIVIVVQSVKKFFPSFEYIRVVVVVGGILYGLMQALVSGLDLLQAGVFVLITSGGAVALYELFKNPLNAAFQVKK